MSKNLNRPFFMDFLAQVSLRFVEETPESEEDDDTGCNPDKVLFPKSKSMMAKIVTAAK